MKDWVWVGGVFAVVTAMVGFVLRPALQGSSTMWLTALGAYAVLGALALARLWHEGTLLDWLRPRWGDISIGAISALVLLLAAWTARSALAPSGSPAQGWLARIYLQLGPGEAVQRSLGLTAAVLAIAVLDELVWRGLVLGTLTNRVGSRWAWLLATLLYGLTATPTLLTLSDPAAGLNPLLLLGALGCGAIWTFIARITQRLPPVMISHMAFTYFSVVQFRLPGM